MPNKSSASQCCTHLVLLIFHTDPINQPLDVHPVDAGSMSSDPSFEEEESRLVACAPGSSPYVSYFI